MPRAKPFLAKYKERAGPIITFETEKFSRTVGTMIAKADIATSDGLVMTMLELMRRTMLRWPVLTGRSRAAWMLPFDAHGRPVSPTAAPEPDEIAVAMGRLESSYEQNLRGPKKSLTVTNGTPYAGMLEFGWSKQAPTGALRNAMREMRGMKPLRTSFTRPRGVLWESEK